MTDAQVEHLAEKLWAIEGCFGTTPWDEVMALAEWLIENGAWKRWSQEDYETGIADLEIQTMRKEMLGE